MKFFIAIAGGCTALLAASAIAAPAPDTPSEIAACVVDNDAADVRRLLAAVPGSRAEAAVTPKVLDYYGGCNDNKPVSGPITWRDRADLADAALDKRLGGKTPNVVAAAAEDGWALVLAKGMTAGADYDAGAVGMRMFGDCVVRAAPQAAVDLARSGVGSAGERVAIGQFSPLLAACIPAGQNMRVKRADLRLIVAEPLYHLVGK